MRKWFNIVAALIIVALIVGLYKAKSDAARASAHVRDLEAQIAKSEADLRALRADIAEQESPANVEALAREHLGSRTRAEPQPESQIDAQLPPAGRESGK